MLAVKIDFCDTQQQFSDKSTPVAFGVHRQGGEEIASNRMSFCVFSDKSSETEKEAVMNNIIKVLTKAERNYDNDTVRAEHIE